MKSLRQTVQKVSIVAFASQHFAKVFACAARTAPASASHILACRYSATLARASHRTARGATTACRATTARAARTARVAHTAFADCPFPSGGERGRHLKINRF